MIGALVLQCAAASSSWAQERAEPRFYARQPITLESRYRISVALFAGYGWTLNPSSIGELNGFDVGFGARGGFNWRSFYVGMRLAFFMGDTRELAGGELSFDETLIGLDMGYDIRFDAFTLRPQLGIGLAMSSAELMGQDGVTADRSSDAAYVAPGVSLMADLSKRLFLGVDVQAPFVLRDPTLFGLSAMLATGMRF